MKVYDLSYSEYTERVTYLFLKLSSNKAEEKEVGELYNLLTADGSDLFMDMSDIMSECIGRAIDFLCYYLLLSVRVTSGKERGECLDNAIKITEKILEVNANEKRE